jgi:uncharacterized ParB-like nuclease family protein
MSVRKPRREDFTKISALVCSLDGNTKSRSCVVSQSGVRSVPA